MVQINPFLLRVCREIALGAVLSMLIPARVAAANFDVRQYGAIGDGRHMDTLALQQATDAAARTGGGTVLFPQGIYLTGTLELKSHVTLRLDQGAVLLGSPHRLDYQNGSFHGLVLADQQTDIAIEGAGVIDGQGTALATDIEGRGDGAKRPHSTAAQRPNLINFRDCTNVMVRGITLRDSASWVQKYRDCVNLTVENITVHSIAAMNNDGLDIDGCTHVVVRGCDINSEDDGICLKSADQACTDVLVENCRVRSSCNALKFGTESIGGFRNITCRDLEIYDTYISAIALESVDGGQMENINISHVKITGTHNALFLRLGHRHTESAVGSIHNVTLSDIYAQIPHLSPGQMTQFPFPDPYHTPSLITASITGLPGHPVQDVTLQNITLDYGGIGNVPPSGAKRWEDLTEIPERAKSYPESRMFGTLPAWGFYCRHVQGLRLKNITLRVTGADYRPALVADDVGNLFLEGVHIPSATGQPVIVFNDVRDATMRDTDAPAGVTNFIFTLEKPRNIESY